MNVSNRFTAEGMQDAVERVVPWFAKVEVSFGTVGTMCFVVIVRLGWAAWIPGLTRRVYDRVKPVVTECTPDGMTGLLAVTK